MKKAISKFLDLLEYAFMILGMLILSGIVLFTIAYPIIDMLVYNGII